MKNWWLKILSKLQQTQKLMAIALAQKKCQNQVEYSNAILTNHGIMTLDDLRWPKMT